MNKFKYIGDLAEDLALKYFCSLNFFLEQKNYHSAYGEIDLILKPLQKNSKLDFLFIEVKARKNLSYGPPKVFFTTQKKVKTVKTIHHYLQKNDKFNAKWNLEFLGLQLAKDNSIISLEHIKHI